MFSISKRGSESILPRLVLLIGFSLWIITCIYYMSILSQDVVFYSTISLFKFYGWAVTLIGAVITLWLTFRYSIGKGLWIFYMVYLVNVLLVYYLYIPIKPLPYELRFVITNCTHSTLNDINILGPQKLHFIKLNDGHILKFEMTNYSENSQIKLICKSGQSIDTLVLGDNLSSSCGFFFREDIKIKNGKLTNK